jgi:hypothetical protein
MLINFSAQANRSDNIFYFDDNSSLVPSEILNVPGTETPAPQVTVYFPRVDFGSGKNKPYVFENIKNINSFLLNNFFNNTNSSAGFNQFKPVYLLNNVFRI